MLLELHVRIQLGNVPSTLIKHPLCRLILLLSAAQKLLIVTFPVTVASHCRRQQQRHLHAVLTATSWLSVAQQTS